MMEAVRCISTASHVAVAERQMSAVLPDAVVTEAPST
jgi:hypothetical protein